MNPWKATTAYEKRTAEIALRYWEKMRLRCLSERQAHLELRKGVGRKGSVRDIILNRYDDEMKAIMLRINRLNAILEELEDGSE